MKTLLRWLVISLILNALWEIAHLPLYTLWQDPNLWNIISHYGHCLAGDGLIAVILFLLIAGLFRTLAWPYSRPWLGGTIFILLAVSYTSYSEWLNVYVANTWAYAPSMPLVAGLGLTPLLQWVVLPAVMIVILRRCSDACSCIH